MNDTGTKETGMVTSIHPGHVEVTPAIPKAQPRIFVIRYIASFQKKGVVFRK